MGRKLLVLAFMAVAIAAAALLLLRWPSGTEAALESGAVAPDAARSHLGGDPPATSQPQISRPAESRSAGRDPMDPTTVSAEPAPQDAIHGVISRIDRGRSQGVVAGAQVSVFPWVPGQVSAPRDAAPLGRAVSGSDGQFVVANLPWSMRFLGRIEAPGFATCWMPFHRGAPQGVHLRPLSTQKGIVTRGPAREPVAGVGIECHSPLGAEPALARTDGKGEFEVALPGAYAIGYGGVELATPLAFALRLILRLPGELPLVRNSISVAAGKRIEIHLEAPRTVFGEVVDLAAGLPVAGASVSGHCQTDALGRFELATSASEGCTVEVTAPGYASVTAGLGVRWPGRHRIALLREALVTGRVHDGTGRPIAGASVTLALWQEALRDRDGITVSELYGKCGKVAPPPKEASKVMEPPFHGPVRTDEHGRFRIGGVGAGAGVVVCRALVSCQGFADGESTLLEVPFPGGHAHVEVPLRGAACLRGTVRLRGTPVVARIQVDAADGLRLESVCDPRGRYLLAGIRAGDAQVEVLVEGLSPIRERRPMTLRAAAEHVLDIDLEPNPMAITGRVVFVGGPAPDNALAHAQEERTDGQTRRYHGPVDRQGGFQIPVPDDAAARFTLSFGSGRARGGRSGVRPGQDVGTVEATRLGLVRAQLVDAATRSPLAVARLAWRRHDTEAWQDATAELGPRQRKPQDPFEVWLPWGLLDLRVEPVSAEHEPCELNGVTVAESQPGLTLAAQRRSGTGR